MKHQNCTVYIDDSCAQPSKFPIKLEIMPQDADCFQVCLSRAEWSRLLRTGREVEGWIEPVEVE